MKDAVEKAKVLLESLPYMREFSGQTVVIKYGGSAMTEENLKQSFALNVVLLKYIGINPVIVHGGGPQIGKMLTQLGIDSTFKQGLRVTDPATMDVVEMVLAGRVNKEIVNLINQSGGLAVGLSGKDGRLIEADKMEMVLSKEDAPPEIIDLGRVGEVQRIEIALLDSLQQRGFIPIIAPVGVDGEGATYNINADDVTASVAEALGAKRMILLTDVEGVTSGGSLLSSLSRFDAVRGIEQGHIQGGMIPKIKCCLEALEAGVDKTHIIDGRVENSILLEMFTNAGIGTEIVP